MHSLHKQEDLQKEIFVPQYHPAAHGLRHYREVSYLVFFVLATGIGMIRSIQFCTLYT